MGKVKFIFAWYDLWIGAYWDKKTRQLYILPFPMIGIVIAFTKFVKGEKVIVNAYADDPNYKGSEFVNQVITSVWVDLQGRVRYDTTKCNSLKDNQISKL